MRYRVNTILIKKVSIEFNYRLIIINLARSFLKNMNSYELIGIKLRKLSPIYN